MNNLQQRMEKINIEIPQFIVEDKSGYEINYDLIDGKKIIGLLGYAGCGKDTVANFLSEFYFYKKIKFGDPLKEMLNKYFKEKVIEDLKINGYNNISFSEIDFFEEEDRQIKDILRPYMVWLGEKLREVNGPYYWINKTFDKLNEWNKNVVIADVRRPDELDLFENNNSQKRTYIQNLIKSNYRDNKEIEKLFLDLNDFETKLFYVNQYGLKERDEITVKTILQAFERWLINDTLYIDSRIPKENRESFIRSEVTETIIKNDF